MNGSLYRTLWRWHFYAGLLCIPFVLLLALTGSLYLFKPQVEHWQDRVFDTVSFSGHRVGAEQEVATALSRVPGARLDSYELPHSAGAAGRVWLRTAAGEKVRVVVHPVSGKVLDVVPEKSRLMNVIHDLHGELLLGDGGSLVVELAGCWAIVMVLSGLYLWWPRGAQGVAGVFYPRLGRGRKVFWRDLHAVTGMWVSCFALFLLLTALPWMGVWGDAFKQVRRVTGTAVVKQDWSSSRSADRDAARNASLPAFDEHAEHRAHMAMAASADAASTAGLSLDAIVARVEPMQWTAPVLISPPGAQAPQWIANAATGSPATRPAWRVRSDAQNRPLRRSMTIDAVTGSVLSQETFAQKQWIDRIVGIGVAAHEGQLFGWFNQLLGALTALGLGVVAVSGAVMWWRRRPAGVLGAPTAPEAARFGRGLLAIIVGLGVFLPVLGASLLAIGLLEWLVLRRIPAVRDWLGLAQPA